MTVTNRPSLTELAHMPIADVVSLPPDVLALLQQDADAALRSARAAKDWLDGAIARRYSGRAASYRRDEGKDTGTTRFQDGSVTVVADLPKRVEWYQSSLADLVERIKTDGEDPREYVEIAFRVSERKYTAWPAHLQSAFAEARTVRTGKETFKLILEEDGL